MLPLDIGYEAFRQALEAIKPGWHRSDRGLIGPEGACVRLAQRHCVEGEGHVDVLFELNGANPTLTHLWDCVSGFGQTPLDRARIAAHIWSQTTAPALLELKYSKRGEFADHYHGHEANGFHGWHVIAGAVLGFGHGESAENLQKWWLKNSVLPTLSTALSDSLGEQSCPHGIKILFGGNDLAEVRVDGECHEDASLALRNLPWPRLTPIGFVRSYVVVLHREPSA
jgi:hypothetical protein